MKSDRTIKVLLFTIAVGLWFNIVGTSVSAGSDTGYQLILIHQELKEIGYSLALLTSGKCANQKLC